uniref:Uncharacterized protein n=1 Tax=Anguilla anguilla TaxID=7936 RepID=A0A0E9QWT4_ANGAN
MQVTSVGSCYLKMKELDQKIEPEKNKELYSPKLPIIPVGDEFS